MSELAGAIRIGSQVGAYEVQEVLGRGGMGTVYKGYHPGLDRVVAIKVLNSMTWDAATAARFQREARIVARLRHPNIVTVYDFGEVGGVPYMAVEYMPGGTIADMIEAGDRFSPADVASVVTGVSAALDYAHGQGVVHRDVKPSNVLISRDGMPVISDFGLSRGRDDVSLTASGFISGTPSYMPPEQAMGRETGPAADLYSLAVMAYELLAGRVPFIGASAVEVLYQHANVSPMPPSALNVEVPKAADAVLLRALAKRPEDRWPTCSDFAAAFSAALSSSVARVASTVEAPTVAIPHPASGDEAAAVPVPAPRRTTALASALPRSVDVAVRVGLVALLFLLTVMLLTTAVGGGRPT